jgi:hypothetical protein
LGERDMCSFVVTCKDFLASQVKFFQPKIFQPAWSRVAAVSAQSMA